MEMVKDYLDMEREGAETFEYVLIVALLCALLVVIFRVLGPAFDAKMKEIASYVSQSGDTMSGIVTTPRPNK